VLIKQFTLYLTLLIAFAGFVSGYNGSFEFKEPGVSYEDYPHYGMRLVHNVVFIKCDFEKKKPNRFKQLVSYPQLMQGIIFSVISVICVSIVRDDGLGNLSLTVLLGCI